MASLGDDKVLSMLMDTERVADQILMNKHEIVVLDMRRQGNREALNEMKRLPASDKSIWTTLGCMIVKMKKEQAVAVLEEDQSVINAKIKKLRQKQKVLVNKLRDLEHDEPLKGFDLKPMSYSEMSAIKTSLHK